MNSSTAKRAALGVLWVIALASLAGILSVRALARDGGGGAAPVAATATPPTWEPPEIGKYASAAELPIGASLWFLLTVRSPATPGNQATWHDVTVTDAVDPAFIIDSVTVDPPTVGWAIIGNTVTATKPSLQPGESFAVRIDCRLSRSAELGDTLENQATVQYDDPDGIPQPPIASNVTKTMVVKRPVFLPVILRLWSTALPAPVLLPINNAGGANNYSVTWSTAAGADLYLLEEALNSGFAGASTVYSGPNTTFAAASRQPTRYFYRVKARNARGDSAWSNTQATDVLWELEPNDDGLTQANGPLVSGLTYYGSFPTSAQGKDYFFFSLSAAHAVEVWLTNIPAGNDFDLVLRRDDLTLIQESKNLGSADEHILTESLAPGRYKIQVFHYSGPGSSSQAYHLRVDYE